MHMNLRTVFLGLTSVTVLLLIVSAFAIMDITPSQEVPVGVKRVSIPVEPIAYDLDMRFFGDVYWGRYVDDWSKASDLGFAYPFSGLESFDKGDQVWIANLECPVTTTYFTSRQQDSTLKFSCLPEYVPEAAKHFDVFSLANNHTDNMEEVDGLEQTREFLSQSGIQYFGHFDNAVKEDLCEVVSMPVQPIFEEGKTPEEIEDYTVPIALCGYHGVFKLPLPDELAVIKKYAEYLPVVAMPHQGAEYISRPDSLQTSTYRTMVDNGADMVIGGHTHSILPFENYQDTLIAYSLGNFIFDQQFSNTVTRGLSLEAKTRLDAEEWEGYINLDCSSFKDTCLGQLKKSEQKHPNIRFTYSVDVTDNSNKLAKKALPDIQEAVKDNFKLNTVLSQLGDS